MKSYQISEIDAWYREVHAGEQILLSGIIYTARDAAHKRLIAALDRGEELPFPLSGTAIYYAGPTPAKNNLPIGACGPTTSSRMDPYIPRLTMLGLRCTIGKGDRNPKVYDALTRYGGIYLCAIGGAGALCAKSIKQVDVIAYPELGCESVKRMKIEDFPLFVGIDATGGSIFGGNQ
jgi:fumarate hydratase subunit beta